MKKILVAGIILLMASAVAFYGIRLGKDKPISGQSPPLPTTIVKRGTLVRAIEASGTIEAARLAELSPPGSGQVRAIHTTKRSYVQAGEFLVELENTQEQLNLLRARNAYENARIEGVPSVIRERELDLEIAETSLERTKIRAPFAGVVADIMVEEGESVGSEQTLIRLLDNQRFLGRVSVDETDSGLIEVGQRSSIDVDALTDEVFSGIVTDVSLIAEESGGVVTIPVEITVQDGPLQKLRVGYSATARIEADRVEDALLVPIEAIARLGQEDQVSLIVDGVPQPKVVETGINDGRFVEITSGLVEGDEIVAFNYAASALGANQRVPAFGPGVGPQMRRP